jgi:hypothetical protein
MSVPAELTKPDGSVLKKVASLTLNKAELESKITKPKFVPEKLDFQLYEKFEGIYSAEVYSVSKKKILVGCISAEPFVSGICKPLRRSPTKYKFTHK